MFTEIVQTVIRTVIVSLGPVGATWLDVISWFRNSYLCKSISFYHKNNEGVSWWRTRISSSLMSLVHFSLSSSKIQLIQSKILQIHLNVSCEDETISWLSAGVTSDLWDSNNVMKADETMMWAERWAWRSFRSQTDETLRNITHPARIHGDQPPPVAMAAAGGPAGHSQRSCEWIIVLLQFLKSHLSEPRAAEQHGLFQTILWCGFSSSSWCLFQSSIRGQILLLPPKLFVVYVGFCHRCVFSW